MAIDFAVGHWTHKRPVTELIGADGQVIPDLPRRAAPRLPAPPGLGDDFKSAHPALFKKCKCDGILAVMSRWKVGEVSDKQIIRVAGTLHSKNKKIPTLEIEQTIRQFLESQTDEN